ncbi:hypothetical protein [Acidianus sp. HS-5]|uniref:hypothetical protein n=1 Tax=Acidianus sp. HS-5 TaxID=2886040 RepID=UPI001F44229D|nr:hypothetical protein [Acidianus sp. HS-5]BDC18361.1 hypothetical protein HS5_12510 [Acidianus sp. HS-5]
MDYIDLALKNGIEKDKAIYTYKALNGGYFMKLYYAKIPIINELKTWPMLYLKKKKYFPKLASPEYNEALQLLITLDIYSILGTSFKLLKNNLEKKRLEDEVKNVYDKIEETCKNENIFPCPMRTFDVNANEDFEPFIQDLLERRLRDHNADVMSTIEEITYNSEFFKELKTEVNWLKVIKVENVIRGIALTGKLEEFLDNIQDIIYLFSAERTLYFDTMLPLNSIEDSIKKVLEDGRKAIKNEIDNEFSKDVNYIYNLIKQQGSYV